MHRTRNLLRFSTLWRLGIRKFDLVGVCTFLILKANTFDYDLIRKGSRSEFGERTNAFDGRTERNRTRRRRAEWVRAIDGFRYAERFGERFGRRSWSAKQVYLGWLVTIGALITHAFSQISPAIRCERETCWKEPVKRLRNLLAVTSGVKIHFTEHRPSAKRRFLWLFDFPSFFEFSNGLGLCPLP